MAFSVQLGNLDTAGILTCQYAPTELKEVYGAEYAKPTIPGLSHKLMQFVSGENLVVDIELDFNQIVEPKTPILEQRRFLQSLLVPRRGATTVTTGSPARVLFSWPEMFLLTCRLTKLEMTHSFFAPTGGSLMFKAKLTLEEARETRLYAEDVLATGTMRSA